MNKPAEEVVAVRLFVVLQDGLAAIERLTETMRRVAGIANFSCGKAAKLPYSEE